VVPLRKTILKKAGYLLAGYAAKNADYRNQQLLPYLENGSE